MLGAWESGRCLGQDRGVLLAPEAGSGPRQLRSKEEGNPILESVKTQLRDGAMPHLSLECRGSTCP